MWSIMGYRDFFRVYHIIYRNDVFQWCDINLKNPGIPWKEPYILWAKKNPDIYWKTPVCCVRVSHTPVCEPLRFTNDEFFVKPREKPCISCKKPSGSCKEPCISWKSITHASVWAAEIHKRQILCKPPGKALYFVQRSLYLVEEYHTRQPRRLTRDVHCL